MSVFPRFTPRQHPPYLDFQAAAESELPEYKLFVDFDATITKPGHHTDSFDVKDLPKPNWKIVKRMRKARNSGIPVSVFSFRTSPSNSDASKQRQLIEDYLKKYDIPYDEIWEDAKPFGFIIDDQAANTDDMGRIDEKLDKMIRRRESEKLAVQANDAKREFGCLMATVPVEIAEAAQTWGQKNISDDKVYTDDSDKYGREKESHVTVNFGFVADPDLEELQRVIAELQPGPVKARLDQVSKFTPGEGKYDVIKVEVYSDDLDKLHAAILERYEIKENHPEYKPHMTIAYVLPGSCDDLLGNADLKDSEFEISEFDYSGIDNGHNEFQLNPAVESGLAFVDHLMASQGIQADQLTELYHAAKAAVEADPRWANYGEDTAVAKEFGELQHELDQARSVDEIKAIWDRFQPSTPFESLLSGEVEEEFTGGIQD